MTKGQRLVLNPSGQIEIEEFEVPAPASNQVLIRTNLTQVSAGSEMNGIRQRRSAGAAERAAFQPTGLGYTAIGTVEAVGGEIAQVAVGDRVLCAGNHASHWLATPEMQAGEVSIMQEFRVEKLPDDLSDIQAAFCVLGDIALHGVRRAQIQIGESVAVHGLGVVGLMALQLSRLVGAYPLIGVDVVEERLEVARRLGASHIVDASRRDVVADVRAHTQLPWRWRGALPHMPQGSGAEVQLHCTSFIGNYPTMIKAAADRGRIILVGATSGSVPIESNELFRREIMMTGSYQTGMNDTHPYWPWTRVRNQHVILDLIRRGELQIDPLVSHVVPYTEAPRLFDSMMTGLEGWLSVFFTWNGDGGADR